MAITLNSKVYNFIGFDKNGVSTYQEVSGGVPSSFSYLTCRVQPATATASAIVRWRLTMPVVAAVDSTCSCPGQVLRTFRYDEGKVEIPANCSTAERTDFQLRVTGLTATTQYLASLNSLVQPSS